MLQRNIGHIYTPRGNPTLSMKDRLHRPSVREP
jgi:hypothetical protein